MLRLAVGTCVERLTPFGRTCGAKVQMWRGRRVRPVLLPVRAEAAGLAVEGAELGPERAGHGGRDVAGVSARCVSGHSSCTWPLRVPDAGAMFPSVDQAVGSAPGALIAPSAAGAPRASDTLQPGFPNRRSAGICRWRRSCRNPSRWRAGRAVAASTGRPSPGRRRPVPASSAQRWRNRPGPDETARAFMPQQCKGNLVRRDGARVRKGETTQSWARGESPGLCALSSASMSGKWAAEGRTRGERYRPNPVRIPVTCCI